MKWMITEIVLNVYEWHHQDDFWVCYLNIYGLWTHQIIMLVQFVEVLNKELATFEKDRDEFIEDFSEVNLNYASFDMFSWSNYLRSAFLRDWNLRQVNSLGQWAAIRIGEEIEEFMWHVDEVIVAVVHFVKSSRSIWLHLTYMNLSNDYILK